MAVARLLVVALGCVALAGCGATERAPDASATAEAFHAAIQQRQGVAACALLAQETRSTLEEEESRPCGEAILTLGLPEGGVAAGASVYVTSASVSLPNGGKTFLDEFDDGWRVSAAGCVPAGPDLPYECTLEG
jgi:hypothetical protein